MNKQEIEKLIMEIGTVDIQLRTLEEEKNKLLGKVYILLINKV